MPQNFTDSITVPRLDEKRLNNALAGGGDIHRGLLSLHLDDILARLDPVAC